MGSRGENRSKCFSFFDFRASCNVAKSQILVMSWDYLSLVICKMGIMINSEYEQLSPHPQPRLRSWPVHTSALSVSTPPLALFGVRLADRGESLHSWSYEGQPEQSWASKPTWFDSKSNTLHSLPFGLLCLCFPGTFWVCCRGNVCSLWAWHLVGTQ